MTRLPIEFKSLKFKLFMQDYLGNPTKKLLQATPVFFENGFVAIVHQDVIPRMWNILLCTHKDGMKFYTVPLYASEQEIETKQWRYLGRSGVTLVLNEIIELPPVDEIVKSNELKKKDDVTWKYVLRHIRTGGKGKEKARKEVTSPDALC